MPKPEDRDVVPPWMRGDETVDAAPRGLSDAEATSRLRRDGPNLLPERSRRNLLKIALGVAAQPMLLLLIVTAAVYGALGSLGDAVALLVSVLAVGGIATVQERRTEQILGALRELSSPRTRVLRSGRVLRVASQDLVVGDRVMVGEGDRLACDAVLVEAHGLMVDESMLTGESAPVMKCAVTAPPLHAPEHRLSTGTLVVQGGLLPVSRTPC